MQANNQLYIFSDPINLIYTKYSSKIQYQPSIYVLIVIEFTFAANFKFNANDYGQTDYWQHISATHQSAHFSEVKSQFANLLETSVLF